MIIHNVQQGSMEWHQLRCGMVTGSRLARVFKSEYLSLIDELIAEQLTEMWEDEGYVSDAMQRGVDLEPVALEAYEKHTGWQVIGDGFIQCDKFPLLGYSPDGRIGVKGNVEVKCPTSKKHIQYLRQQQLPNDYKWQVLGAFIINPDLQWSDFVSFDPRVTQRPLFIHRTEREDVLTELNTAVDQLEKFFEKLNYHKQLIVF